MMIDLFFTVITVTKNNLYGLKQTYKSVQTQKTDLYEWIVIDGASEDGTQDFLAETKAEWISAPDQSHFEAMNKGLDRAKGAYVLFMNAGDCFAKPDTLEKIAKTLGQKRPDFLYGDALEDPDFYKPAKDVRHIHTGMITHHQAMFYKRAKINAAFPAETGISQNFKRFLLSQEMQNSHQFKLRHNPQYKIAADYDFTARFLKYGSETLHLPFPICLYESGGLSQKNAALGRREEFEIRKNLGLCFDFQNHLIYWKQSLAWLIRQNFPFIYRLLRGRLLHGRQGCNSENGSAQA